MIIKSLSEIAYVTMGQSPKGKTCNEVRVGKPLLNGPTEFGAFTPIAVQYSTGGNKFSKNGDILFCVRGSTTGRMNWSDKEYVLGRGLASIRHKAGGKLNHFLKYLIEHHLGSILKSTSGSTFPNLTREMLCLYKFILPDERSQFSINKLLKNIDAKIELNNRINTQLEQMAKTIYDYWFVQFDFPNGQGKPYKSSGGKMVYNKELKREISEGWEVKPLADWINKDKGGDWGKESEEANYSKRVNCIRGADINGLIGKGELKSPIRYILEKNSSKILQPNDLIIEISGGSPTQSTGRLAYITENTFERFDNPVICSNFCKAINLKEDNHLYYFAYYWNLIYESNILFGWEGKTSGIKNLLFESFVNYYKIPVPNELLIEKFNALITPIESKKQKNLKQNQELASLRDWLLPMLMNGQVTVKEAEEKLDRMGEFNQSIAAEPEAEYHK